MTQAVVLYVYVCFQIEKYEFGLVSHLSLAGWDPKKTGRNGGSHTGNRETHTRRKKYSRYNRREEGGGGSDLEKKGGSSRFVCGLFGPTQILL